MSYQHRIENENGRRYTLGLPLLKPGHVHGVSITVLGWSLDNEVTVQFTNYWNDNGKTLPDAHTVMSLEEFEKHCKDHGYTWADFSNGQSIECMESNHE